MGAGDDTTTTREPAQSPGDKPPRGPGDGLARGPMGEQPGDFIGPYALLRVIGEGGFGIVWLAERREPMVQRVALKIIKPGMDSKAVIARFEQERQTLAILDHPGIAKVFDAGATPAGRPFFVMELVEGEPITGYCDAHELSTARRLDLFAQVCDAVQHAHTKGVIHRDLKPSNILVGHRDGRPVPKVIDFGIAKAIDHRAAEKSIFTLEGQLIGTPEYMSPEQAGGEPDIDTRTDVYALGVVLYEVLTGLLPFDPRTLRAAGFAEILRIIREVDPPRPSTRLSTLGADARVYARTHGSGVGALARELRRELEWVPLRAMRKRRAERYATAKELGDDVRNYLGGRPLAAGPDSAWYTVRKIARRHRVAFGAGACIMAAVIGGAGLATYWAVKESRARALADRARADEATQRRVAEAVNGFLNDMLGANDPRLPRERRARTVGEAVDIARRRLDAGALADQPAVEAEVRGTMGNALFGVGEPAAAEQELRRALDLAARTHGEGSLQHARAMHNLAEVLLDSKTPAEAERLAHEAAAVRERVLGAEDPRTLASRDVEALAMFRQGRFDDTIRADETLLPVRERVCGEASVPVAETLAILGNALWEKGRTAEASERWSGALKIFSSGLGADHPYAIMCRSNLAQIAEAEGRLDEADALATRAVDEARRILGSSHQDLAVYLTVLAQIRLDRGDATSAASLAADSAAIRRTLLGEDHPSVAQSLVEQGNAARQLGDLPGAVGFFRRACDINRAHADAIGREPLIRSLMLLASGQTLSGDTAGAAAALEEAVALARATAGNPMLGRALSDLAYARLLLGEHERAAADAGEALTLLTATDDDRARTLLMRVMALIATGRPAECETPVREAVAIRRGLFPADSWQVASARSALGAVLTALGKFGEAETELLGANAAYEAAPNVPPLRKREAATRLADLYAAWGKPDEADRWRERAAHLD